MKVGPYVLVPHVYDIYIIVLHVYLTGILLRRKCSKLKWAVLQEFVYFLIYTWYMYTPEYILALNVLIRTYTVLF